MPDAHDRALLFDGLVVGVDDVPAAVDAHRAAHDGAVRAKGNCANTVDGAGRGEYSGPVTFVQQLNAAVVEEVGQPQQRVSWVERFFDRLGRRERHRCLLPGFDSQGALRTLELSKAMS